MNNGEQFFNTAGGYSISRSLRCNSSDSAYLSRTPASAGNQKTWTWSGWLKRSNLTDQQAFWSAGSTGTNRTSVLFDGSAKIRFFNYAGSVDVDLVTTPVYRDASAWYHFVIAVDTTQGTASNRIKLYVNGVEVTAFSTSTYPSSSQDLVFNSAIAHGIGRGEQSGGEYFSGYLADIHFIDGQALDPTSFGEFDDNGIWQPIDYTGSFGTNGFHLPFDDNSTAAALGTDSAGSNDWTVNNLSVTAGAGNDSLVDVPTNGAQTDTGAGGEVRGNYATLNPLNYTGTVTLSNGNLDATGSNANASSTIAPSSGKWYAEFSFSAIGAAVGFVGISNKLSADAFSGATQTWQLNYTNTGKLENAGSQSNVTTFTTGDIIGVAFDCSNGQATFYKNGSSVGTITGSAFVGIPVLIGVGAGGTSGTNTFTANYGARSFAYTAPSGFKALCTANLISGSIITSGSFTGNANADGPFVWLNGVPTAMTINGNAVTFGTHADKLANGFKLRTNNTSYNTSGSNTYSITTTGDNFKVARAQPNP